MVKMAKHLENKDSLGDVVWKFHDPNANLKLTMGDTTTHFSKTGIHFRNRREIEGPSSLAIPITIDGVRTGEEPSSVVTRDYVHRLIDTTVATLNQPSYPPRLQPHAQPSLRECCPMCGPQGPAGECGQRGCRGPQGNTGYPGCDGDRGKRGPQGLPGTQGNDGPPGCRGKKGHHGPQGYVGPFGEPGTQGFQGKRGRRGECGERGCRGHQGNDGQRGYQGNDGKDGNDGERGYQGNDGQRGYQGIDGKDGDRGYQGRDGYQGIDGKDGDRGYQGRDGYQGIDGKDGNDGKDGDRGYQGTDGKDGNDGKDGDRGYQGTDGKDGNDGKDGDRGYQGVAGDRGYQGNDGPQGRVGDTGVQGSPKGIDSICIWSERIQGVGVQGYKYYQRAFFEAGVQGPPGSGFSLLNGPQGPYAIQNNTGATAYCMVSYKLDIRSAGGGPSSSSTTAAATLMLDDEPYPASTTLVQAPETNHIYTVPNTLLVNFPHGSVISLMWWANDSKATIGEPATLTGKLPGSNVVPKETTALLMVTRIA